MEKGTTALAKGNVYALLVGINDYAPSIGKLQGCVNDVDCFHQYLKSTFKADALRVEVLKDSDATRDNIVNTFRSHLSEANEGDVALFQYCGHGARSVSAPEFLPFFPDGRDEGFVCYDSRHNGVYDLADKEIAVLLAEVARNNPHLAVILDCCHSGSATRSTDDSVHARARQTSGTVEPRPLGSYFDGYYENLHKKNQPLNIPSSRHMLMAACGRREKAWESKNSTGVFTDTLMDVLQQSPTISYADLFVRCRLAVRKHAQNQNPQFESYNHFNAHDGFLGRNIARTAAPFRVHFDADRWRVNCGSLHGLSTDLDSKAALALYPESTPTQLAGYASPLSIGAQHSALKLEFDADVSSAYKAENISLPAAPMPVYVSGNQAGRVALENELKQDASIGVAFTELAKTARYAIDVQDGRIELVDTKNNRLIQAIESNELAATQAFLAVVKKVAHWERSLALQHTPTRMDTALFDCWFSRTLADGSEQNYPEKEITLNYADEKIHGRFYLRNHTPQKLHVVMLHYSEQFGIHVLYNDEIVPRKNRRVVAWGDDPHSDYFYLDNDQKESEENLKFIISTEKIDDFLLVQEGVNLGETLHPTDTQGTKRGIGNTRTARTYRNEWFTHTLRISLIRNNVDPA